MPRTFDWSRRPLSLMIALFVAISAAALSAAGLFDPIEDTLIAKRAELLTTVPSGEIAIVEIDANSLSRLSSWPWPRGYHARLIDELHRANASVIAFDVDFSARSGEEDADLARAVREAGHVVLPIFQQKSSDRATDRRVLASRPTAALGDAWVGGVNIFPDPDGMVRAYPAATVIEGAIQPSIATLVAERDGLGDRSFQPDWAIDASRFPRYSFVDVMEGRVPADRLKGKRVLIGATAIELGDRYNVPRFGVVPGVVVQALAAESLLQDRAIQRTSLPVTILGILLIAASLVPRPLPRSARYAAVSAILLVAILALPVLVQRSWPVSIDSAAWLVTLFASAAVAAAVEARRRLHQRARFDMESGLPNRSTLEGVLAHGTGGEPILVAAAIERFETIRDTIGIGPANELIRSVAQTMAELVGGIVYRIAPDVLAWTQPDGDRVPKLLDQVQNAFRAPVQTGAAPVDVTFTFGLDSDTAGSAAVLRIERALSAIGSARSMGKTLDWYSGSDPMMLRQLSLMGELRQAMELGRLSLAYQPKLSLKTGRIADAEALIRWHDEGGNIVPPDEFIPLAEATGVIREVTSFALHAALADLTRWSNQGRAVRAAINLSALDLVTQGFVEQVDRALQASRVPPSQLTFEITESALIRSPAEAVTTLNALRQRGVRLSVDDYGTGQSTLSYLRNLPVHELKIDKSFVTSMARNESDVIMVRSTINLAHELGLEVVAEGIEDEESLRLLKELGCDYAQGYFIGKPVAAEQFFELASGDGDLRFVA